MSEPTVNHHVKDRNAIELTNRAPSRLSATLAKGPQAVKNRDNWVGATPHAEPLAFRIRLRGSLESTMEKDRDAPLPVVSDN